MNLIIDSADWIWNLLDQWFRKKSRDFEKCLTLSYTDSLTRWSTNLFVKLKCVSKLTKKISTDWKLQSEKPFKWIEHQCQSCSIVIRLILRFRAASVLSCCLAVLLSYLIISFLVLYSTQSAYLISARSVQSVKQRSWLNKWNWQRNFCRWRISLTISLITWSKVSNLIARDWTTLI